MSLGARTIRPMSPEAWSAWAGWATALIALVTVIVAGRYASQQVKVARETRDEQAQPNVVLFTEPNPEVPQVLEIVLKNFGATPAYEVKIIVNSKITSTPNLETGEKLADVQIPDFPILAPGQEWRTVWDSATSRRSHQRQLRDRVGLDGFDEDDIQALTPSSEHEARVTYTDSKKRRYETPSVLDFNLREGTTWVDIKTVHDLTQMLQKRFDTMNDGLAGIHRRLAEFGTEHGGIWIYGSGDDDEREYRRQVARDEDARRQSLMDYLSGRREHYQPSSKQDETTDSSGANSTVEQGDK